MFGSAHSQDRTKVLLLGSGELGKEVAIECQRLGFEVVACDRYENAPAMQVAHKSVVVDMLNAAALESLIQDENPDYVVPEIEAIATDALVKLEAAGVNIVPTAKATQLTMNREGIRRLAAEELQVPTSPYRFADTYEEYRAALEFVGLPCVIKPVMSSSGKGQSIIKSESDIDVAWEYAQSGGRTGAGRIIVEGFIDFDYEITLLTVSAVDGVHFCAPIGHRQEDGDYRESWQPQAMSANALKLAQEVAGKVVKALGGYGVFGVELFVNGDNIIFNEVSPRPHDTGLVTLISQDVSEFALHVRAFTGLPIHSIEQLGCSASAALLGNGVSSNLRFDGLGEALAMPKTQVRLFAKPEINGTRRLGVTLTRRDSIEEAIADAKTSMNKIQITY